MFLNEGKRGKKFIDKERAWGWWQRNGGYRAEGHGGCTR